MILNVAVRGEIAFALSATTPGRLTVCRLTGFTDIQIFLQVLLWSALIYILTAVPALRNNIDACFNFEKDEIKPESLAAGWQTSGTTKLTRFAYNLWNGCDDKSCTPYDLFDCSFAPYMYEAVKLRYPEYTRQLDDMVIDDARN